MVRENRQERVKQQGEEKFSQDYREEGGGRPQPSGAGKAAEPQESEAQREEPEVEAREEFDPETADREHLLAKYRELLARLQEVEERFLRVAAEAENFKKRVQRDKEEQARYANEMVIRELLPVIDNLERALDHAQGGANQENLLEGLRMTLRGFKDTLARFGCTEVEAEGKTFDPNYHEAVSQEETTEVPDNTVVRQLQKGYLLKDRLLRPALVVVARSTGSNAEATQQEQTTTG